MRSIAFTAHQRAELIEVDEQSTLAASEIRARTLLSLTSPGTELNGGYLGTDFPKFPGYAAIAKVVEVGSEVDTLAAGDIVLCPGAHSEMVRCAARDASRVPADLPPELAVFARLLGVGMSAINVMSANPPSRVLVTGLGPIGNLAAQMLAACGFMVTSVDPVASRRALAERCGLTDVREDLTGPGPELKDAVRTHFECSGHESGVMAGIQVVGRLGEILLIGVPWRRSTDVTAHALLDAIFRRYVSVRSGWEWQVPRYRQPNQHNSIEENYAAAFDWLRSGRIQTAGLAGLYRPEQAAEVYEGLARRSLPTISAIFDWRHL